MKVNMRLRATRIKISTRMFSQEFLLVLMIWLLQVVATVARTHFSGNETGSMADTSRGGRRSLLNNGLGRTPPMGWNSWNHFGCKIDEKLIKQTADVMVSRGLADLGYRYINIGKNLSILTVMIAGQNSTEILRCVGN
ncbi:Alpha-galactosidase [Bienertia sinuspersici]